MASQQLTSLLITARNALSSEGIVEVPQLCGTVWNRMLCGDVRSGSCVEFLSNETHAGFTKYSQNKNVLVRGKPTAVFSLLNSGELGMKKRELRHPA